jgi:hypothetical protein
MPPPKLMRLKITGIAINNAGDQRMKAIIVIGILCALMGCTTQATHHSAYQPAKRGGIGYQEFALSDTHYRVQFKARGNQRTAARDYALLRAAELSLQQGYDWFVVSKQTARILDETDESLGEPEWIETRQCGLLGCRSQTRHLPSRTQEISETYTLVLLDIHMGKGIRPEKNSYDASEIHAQFAQQ